MVGLAGLWLTCHLQHAVALEAFMHTIQPNAACIVYQELGLTVVDDMQCCQAFLPCWMLLSPAMADIQSSGQSGRCGGSLWSCKVAFALKRGHGQMTLVSSNAVCQRWQLRHIITAQQAMRRWPRLLVVPMYTSKSTYAVATAYGVLLAG